MEPITFKINAAQASLWMAWSKNKYDETGLQPILELIDNSFAANPTEIHMTVNFAEGMASIEDNGIGLPTDSAGLNRCFSYGMRNPTQLNEHGCGLKSSLAILDPSDTKWKVSWKRDGKMYEFKGPCYTSDNQQHTVTTITKWPGKLAAKHGTRVEFPITKEMFSSLYTSKNAKKHEEDIINRLVEEFSHYWMLFPEYKIGRINLFLNDKQISPFSIPLPYTNYKEEETPQTVEKTLSTKANVTITYFRLANDLSRWYKKNYSSTGFYFFKNGRFIQSIHDGRLYKQLSGSVFDSHHSGFIAIINVTAKSQDALPPTVTTKNKFDCNHPLFLELCEIVRPVVDGKISKKHSDESEEKKMDRYQEMRVRNFEEEDEHYKFDLKETMRYNDREFSAPQLDGIEEFKDKIYVYEAKKHSQPRLQDILQLYGNWILANQVLDHAKKKIPVLLVDYDGKSVIDDKLKFTIGILHENCSVGFPLEIRNYTGAKLFPVTK